MDGCEYLDMAGRLRVNRTGGEVAPHKRVLLLAVLELVERGEIRDGFVPLSAGLERGEIREGFVPLSDRLERAFRGVWERVVPRSSRFQCKLCYPFWHMGSEPFWELVRVAGDLGHGTGESLLRADHGGRGTTAASGSARRPLGGALAAEPGGGYDVPLTRREYSSMTALRRDFCGARLEVGLWQCLQDAGFRARLRGVLLGGLEGR